MDLANEQLIPFSQARDEFPGRKRVGLATLHRWRQRGVRGGIILETMVVGGVRFTSREAIQRFVAAMNSPQSVRSELTADQRQARSEMARAILAGRGI